MLTLTYNLNGIRLLNLNLLLFFLLIKTLHHHCGVGDSLAAGAGGRQHSAESDSDSKFKLEPANLKASTTMIVYY